jgi:hypothetical protein
MQRPNKCIHGYRESQIRDTTVVKYLNKLGPIYSVLFFNGMARKNHLKEWYVTNERGACLRDNWVELLLNFSRVRGWVGAWAEGLRVRCVGEEGHIAYVTI